MSKKGRIKKITRVNLAASLVSILLLSILTVAWFRPQLKISTLEDLGIVVAIEITAYALAYLTSDKDIGRTIIKMLAYSAFFAFVITFILQPKSTGGFGTNLLIVFFAQIVSYMIAVALV